MHSWRSHQIVNLITLDGSTDKTLKNEIEILETLQGCRCSNFGYQLLKMFVFFVWFVMYF